MGLLSVISGRHDHKFGRMESNSDSTLALLLDIANLSNQRVVSVNHAPKENILTIAGFLDSMRDRRSTM